MPIRDYRVLGPVEARDDGAEIVIPGVKRRTVLAALLLARGAVVTDAELSGLLWGDRPPPTSAAQIYTNVSRVRRALGPWAGIRREAHGYRMRIGDDPFDLREFEILAGRGRTAAAAGRHQEAARLLRAALAVWRAPALTGVTEHLIRVARPPLEETRLVALEQRVHADLELGASVELLPELAVLVAGHPRREVFRAQLVTALNRTERKDQAMSLYEETHRLLTGPFGLHPAHRPLVAEPR
ncbi:winged helix-turn-helix domain-containing protein [Streptosporangiaceae bacterium NEAU-GS5]|nr:winged helix-turn-helix domain-containing protein [Streptosporangiaceae bacterium NEAU-GS5]